MFSSGPPTAAPPWCSLSATSPPPCRPTQLQYCLIDQLLHGPEPPTGAAAETAVADIMRQHSALGHADGCHPHIRWVAAQQGLNEDCGLVGLACRAGPESQQNVREKRGTSRPPSVPPPLPLVTFGSLFNQLEQRWGQPLCNNMQLQLQQLQLQQHASAIATTCNCNNCNNMQLQLQQLQLLRPEQVHPPGGLRRHLL